MSRDYEHIQFGSNISCMHLYSSVSISTQNLKCLASPITNIWLGQNLKNKKGHVTLTMPLLGVVCHSRLGLENVYMRAKFNNSSFSHSRDVIGSVKI